MKLEVKPMEHIQDVIDKAYKLAIENNTFVEFTFNDVKLIIDGETNKKLLLIHYYNFFHF